MALHDEAKLDQKFIALAKQVNLYLNHFPRHERYGLALEIRKAAYDVYNIIVECQKRYQKKTSLTNLDIRHEQLRMLARFTLAGTTRGINFVGYRAWASKRFVRRHSLYTFRKSLKRGNLSSLASILGHARKTHSLQHLLTSIKEQDHAIYRQLPKIYRQQNHPRTALA